MFCLVSRIVRRADLARMNFARVLRIIRSSYRKTILVCLGLCIALHMFACVLYVNIANMLVYTLCKKATQPSLQIPNLDSTQYDETYEIDSL